MILQNEFIRNFHKRTAQCACSENENNSLILHKSGALTVSRNRNTSSVTIPSTSSSKSQIDEVHLTTVDSYPNQFIMNSISLKSLIKQPLKN